MFLGYMSVMDDRYEVEVKCPVLRTEDPELMERTAGSICDRIASAGGKNEGKRRQSDLYLNHPCRDFARTDESVRIRSEMRSGGTKLKITYKGPKVSGRSKARAEQEIELAKGTDPGTLLSFFRSIGFTEVVMIEKIRDIFKLEGVELSVDRVKGLGVFVEAEKVAASVPEAEAEIIALMDSLGFKDRERRSYLELLLEG
jgi:adenylate cyclase class 2